MARHGARDPTPWRSRRVGLIAAVAAGAALLLGIGGTVAVMAALSGGRRTAGARHGPADVGGSVTLPAEIEVAGDTVWTPTGLDCSGGQRLLLTATGEVEVEDLGGLALTPEGAQQQYSDDRPATVRVARLAHRARRATAACRSSSVRGWRWNAPATATSSSGFNDSDPGGERRLLHGGGLGCHRGSDDHARRPHADHGRRAGQMPASGRPPGSPASRAPPTRSGGTA